MALAGCSNRVGATDEEEQDDVDVYRRDGGIAVKNLEVYAEGERDCYHTFEATVINENEFTVTDLVLEIRLVNEENQYLTTFDTGFARIGAGQSKPLKVESGPQRNECWFGEDATDYMISASYKEDNSEGDDE